MRINFYISGAEQDMFASACEAVRKGLSKSAIDDWRKVFGNEFPTYG